MSHARLLALAALTLAAGRAAAQPPLAVGARARVTAPALGHTRRVASVLAQRGDTLALRPEGTQDSLSIPMVAVTRLDVSRGRHTHIRRGLVLGLLGGAVLGAAGANAAYEPDPCEHAQYFGCIGPVLSRSEQMLLGGALAGVLGAAAGSAVGALWRTERWESVPLGARSARVRVAPAHGGGLALAVVF